MAKLFSNWKQDVPASFVVFFVALPLCLGVALASTGSSPQLFSGIISGTIGGVIVGLFSKSRLGVSGPAAGLITIVLGAIGTLGSFEGFLVAVVLAGILQIIAGFLGWGILGNFFPSSVIKGMLAAIGITLILKEIPHAVGYDADFMGDESFFQLDGRNTFTEIFEALAKLNMGSIIVSSVSILLLIVFNLKGVKRFKLFQILPGAFFVVLFGVIINQVFYVYFPTLYIGSKHLVNLPIINSGKDLASLVIFPDFAILADFKVYKIAFVIFVVASLETLLSVEATDKLDPKKFRTPSNRELIAQGIGNSLSGLIGGLPITQVIVRSSANISAGGESKLSTILHGFLLLVTAIFIPSILNLIPLASLAAILLLVGYKLSTVGLYKNMYKLGFEQFVPFVVTVFAVLFTDLLNGIMIGMCISIFYILRKKFRNKCSLIEISEKDAIIKEYKIVLIEEVSFLNKGNIAKTLKKIPANSKVIIDGSASKEIDHDVLEFIFDFKHFIAPEKNIELTTKNINELTNSSNNH